MSGNCGNHVFAFSAGSIRAYLAGIKRYGYKAIPIKRKKGPEPTGPEPLY